MRKGQTIIKRKNSFPFIFFVMIVFSFLLFSCREERRDVGTPDGEIKRREITLKDITVAAKEDSVRLEQAISDFSALMKYADEESRSRAMQALVDEYAPRSEDMDRIDILIRKYLNDPNSPMRDEEIFILYLQKVSASSAAPPHIVEKALFSLKEAMMNRPGAKSADFPMLLRANYKGKKGNRDNRDSASPVKTTFHKTLLPDTTLVIFYDPDCEQCRKLISKLSTAPGMETGKILAVDVTSDKDRWLRSEHSLPEGWMDSFASTQLEDNNLYAFPALPSLYLLAPDGKVILKDFTPGL